MTSTTTTTIPKTTCLGSFTLYYLLPLPLVFGIIRPELPNVALAIFPMANNAILDYTMCWHTIGTCKIFTLAINYAISQDRSYDCAFQPSLIFTNKVGKYLSRTPLLGQAPGLVCKFRTRVWGADSDMRTSLRYTSIIFRCKKVYCTCPLDSYSQKFLWASKVQYFGWDALFIK